MTKNRKNAGLNSLRNLEVGDITKGANLKENTSIKKEESSNNEKSKIARLVHLPYKLDHILVEAKEECKITGGIASYIVNATREKMERDGLI